MYHIVNIRAVNAHTKCSRRQNQPELATNINKSFKTLSFISMVDALVNISTILNWCKSGYSTGSVNYVSEGSVSISTCITQQYSNLKNHVTKNYVIVISGILGIYVLPRVSLLGFLLSCVSNSLNSL